jgi:glycosyltransferase involved in cell wall biosynthesis
MLAGPHAGCAAMKLAIVVQRYGAEINGGAELHARYIAEHLAAHADVRVLTTCARDYVTWRNEFPAGAATVNGIPVERFPVDRERNVEDFGRRSERVFDATHSLSDELRWLDSEGPACRRLVQRLRESGSEFDYVLLFSVRYYHAYYGARAVPERAVLVPTAEREPSIGLSLFRPIFRGVRAIMYNSLEERAAIAGLADNGHVPGVVVGIGSDVPDTTAPERVRAKYRLERPFVLYVGRIDENKGCGELFDFFEKYIARTGRELDLVLIGNAVMPVPAHPRIRHLGFAPDADKFDAMAAADVLVMPSYFESLSMAALEAWALGTPVLANAQCDVLVGQCLRSNGGLYYANEGEFAAALDVLLDDRAIASALGANGREYFQRHYSWPVIVRKYLDMFERLSAEPPGHRMEPLPGWFARQARTIPAAARVVRELPAGPVVDGRGRGPRTGWWTAQESTA